MAPKQVVMDKLFALKGGPIAVAYFASGCFWGTEYFFMRAPGVVATCVGYMGGDLDYPSYEAVCGKNTGHLEATQVRYDPTLTSYETLLRLFFETHDFTQVDGQGPDIGPQYRSCIFYQTETERLLVIDYLEQLHAKGFAVATMLRPMVPFWPAEDYHQQYYEHRGATPYCHIYRKLF